MNPNLNKKLPEVAPKDAPPKPIHVEEALTSTSSASSQQVASQDTPVIPSDQAASQPAPGPKRKRPCGAEIKRRRKAREAAARGNLSGNPAPKIASSSSSPGVGRPAPTRASQTQPSKAGGSKRPRSECTTPSPKMPEKKTRAAPTKQTKNESYAEKANSHLRVAIINKLAEFGRLTPEQASEIERKLLEELDKILFNPTSSTSKIPTFGGIRLAGDTLRVACDDSDSLKWLQAAVGAIAVEGTSLGVIQVADLPRLSKLSIWIPGKPEDKGVVLARLAAQNPQLKVASWCCFHTARKEEESPGHLLVMGIGEGDATKLAECQGKLKYRFSTLTAKVTKSVTKEVPMETDGGEPSSGQDEAGGSG